MSAMDRIVTLAERKAAEAERRQSAVDAMRPVLAAYAREHGGRFLLFGSAARGQMSISSWTFRLTRSMTPGTLPSAPAGTGVWSRTSRRSPGARRPSWPTLNLISR